MSSPPPDDITSLADIQQLAVQGFRDWRRYGHVSIHVLDDLLIFNYTAHAIYEARWNFFESVSRGLIINSKTGEIVARGFDKFFNWGQDGRFPSLDADMVAIIDKVDGSLGVLFRHQGQYRIATRGSFDSPQAQWATAFLNARYDLAGLPDDLTLLFEIIYPDNRIVVDYGEREDLVLLAARNRHTGMFLPFFPDVEALGQRYDFSLPQTHTFEDVAQILAQMDVLEIAHEGFVVEFSDGSRFKFKGRRYMELQKLLLGLTFKNTLKAIMSGTLEELYKRVPDEFLGDVRAWAAEIDARVQTVKATIEALYDQAPQTSRKEFAVWVMQNYPDLKRYLFAQFDQRPLEPIIYVEEEWQDRKPTLRADDEG